MLSRNQHQEQGVALPKNWQDDACQLLESAFKGKYNPDDRKFFAFAQIFPGELFIATSLMHMHDEMQAPVTYCISTEIKADQEHSKLTTLMVDSAGIFFDSYFAVSDWSDYCSTWTEFNFKGKQFHYKVTRENIELTLRANELLDL